MQCSVSQYAVQCSGGRAGSRLQDSGGTSWGFLYIILHCTLYTVHCTMLYCTVLHPTLLYCTVLYFIALYCTVLYYSVMYFTVLKHTAQHRTILYYKQTRQTLLVSHVVSLCKTGRPYLLYYTALHLALLDLTICWSHVMKLELEET